MPGRMVHGDLEPDEAQSHPVGQFFNVVWFGEFQPVEQFLSRPEREALCGIAQQCAVARVDVRRDAFRVADGGDGPDMVDMTVSKQDGGRPEPMLGQKFVDPGLGVLARIDDHALLTRRRRNYITVGSKRAGREPCDEHIRPFSRYGVSGYRGDPHGREPITKGTDPGIRKVRFANDREYCGRGFLGVAPGSQHRLVSRSKVCTGFDGLPPVNTSGSRIVRQAKEDSTGGG